jgi:hypothetical protein
MRKHALMGVGNVEVALLQCLYDFLEHKSSRLKKWREECQRGYMKAKAMPLPTSPPSVSLQDTTVTDSKLHLPHAHCSFHCINTHWFHFWFQKCSQLLLSGCPHVYPSSPLSGPVHWIKAGLPARHLPTGPPERFCLRPHFGFIPDPTFWMWTNIWLSKPFG